MNNCFVIKGDICDSGENRELRTTQNGFLVVENGVCTGVFSALPVQYHGLRLLDYTGLLVLPGMTDLHTHAPQFAYRGMGMDLELLDWLETYAFPEEEKYSDPEYAKEAYSAFANTLKAGATTRACVFATVHTVGTMILMEALENAGLYTLVGKVAMDRNAPDALTAYGGITDMAAWIEAAGRFERCRPILTPRFVPSCTDALLDALGALKRQFSLPVQSHLSENTDEIEWVRQLCPFASFYGEVYDHFGLFDRHTVMAHCVHTDEKELERIVRNGVFIAHCPQSNTNIASGIAPVRTFLDRGVRLGLGTDVAGGAHLSMFRAITDAVQVSKLRWRLVDQGKPPVTFAEAFYLATRGGGAFFGKTGAFDKGFDADILVIDDKKIPGPTRGLTLAQRCERCVYLDGERHILSKFVKGEKLL